MAEILNNSDLEKISGGLSYQGQEIDPNKTIAELCVEYPVLRTKLGLLYYSYANMTVQELIDQFGDTLLQTLIDQNG